MQYLLTQHKEIMVLPHSRGLGIFWCGIHNNPLDNFSDFKRNPSFGELNGYAIPIVRNIDRLRIDVMKNGSGREGCHG